MSHPIFTSNCGGAGIATSSYLGDLDCTATVSLARLNVLDEYVRRLRFFDLNLFFFRTRSHHGVLLSLFFVALILEWRRSKSFAVAI